MIKRKKVHYKNHRFIFGVIILFLIVGMGIGYSYLTTSLSIGGNITVNKPKELLINKIKEKAAADNVSSEYVTSSTGIDFSKISSDTNGKGVYLLSSTKDDTNPIYYYRGAVTNNNVKFANFCWKIVRTTATGGVKLIYNGTPNADGGCTNTGTASQITTSAFNTNYNDNAYVGYMYGTTNSTYDNTHKNTNNSTIKGVIDDWYKNNMTDYTDKLEDTVWCNDRSLSSGSGTGATGTNYGAYNRLKLNKTPSLECTNPNDRFTVDSANGNGALTYPVALLTADEVVYAGGVNTNTYYLYTGQWYWTMSPSGFTSGGAGSEFFVDSDGDLRNYYGVHATGGGVRTSVSLKPGTKITEGDGTSGSPYVIE